jgi:uncharacterized membrane protein
LEEKLENKNKEYNNLFTENTKVKKLFDEKSKQKVNKNKKIQKKNNIESEIEILNASDNENINTIETEQKNRRDDKISKHVGTGIILGTGFTALSIVGAEAVFGGVILGTAAIFTGPFALLAALGVGIVIGAGVGVYEGVKKYKAYKAVNTEEIALQI